MNDLQPDYDPLDDEELPTPKEYKPGSGRLGIVLAIGVCALGVGFGVSQYSAVKKEGARQQALEQIRREYLERASLALTMADPGRYEEERRALFKWYFNALTNHSNKYPEAKDYFRFEKELKKKGGSEAASYEKRYQLIKSFWERMSSGKYIPVFTAFDQGIRFDIYKLETLTLSDGDPGVRLYFALYGVQRQWGEEQTSSGGRLLRMRVNTRFDGFRVDGRDEAGKPKFEMSLGSGEPFNINHPERFIEEFPPAMVLGYYEIPRIPSVAAAVEMAFQIGTRSVVSGQEVQGNFVWKMTDDMPKELKLPSGQEWKNAEKKVIENSD
jgi:hypothetical protein